MSGQGPGEGPARASPEWLRLREPADAAARDGQGDEKRSERQASYMGLDVSLFGAMGFEEAGVQLTDRGFVKVNDGFETSVPGVYAIGDVIGAPIVGCAQPPTPATKPCTTVVSTLPGGGWSCLTTSAASCRPSAGSCQWWTAPPPCSRSPR